MGTDSNNEWLVTIGPAARRVLTVVLAAALFVAVYVSVRVMAGGPAYAQTTIPTIPQVTDPDITQPTQPPATKPPQPTPTTIRPAVTEEPGQCDFTG